MTMREFTKTSRAWRGLLAGLMLVAAVLSGAAVAAQQAVDPGRLVGAWRGFERTGELMIAGEVLFYDNGWYQKSFAMGQLMSFNSGVWTVQANWVHFEPRDYEPKEYLGRPQYPPPSETWVVDHFDGVNLHATVGMTEVSYQRVQ